MPVPLTSLVGRQVELRELTAALGRTRLLTVTGTGGAGKTRLVLALAWELAARPDLVVAWVDLGWLVEPGLVGATVAAAVGAVPGPDADPVRATVAHLATGRTVLVLDNCEAVAAECAQVTAELLGGSPDLQVVATSRAVLGLPGELLHRLEGLSVDDPPAGGIPEAVQLFTERAKSLLPTFGSPADLTAAGELCARLDGLPLAVELAAARVNVLSVPDITRRLARDAGFLRRPGAVGPARHLTLQATLDWSYQLLSPEERGLLRRLAAFQGTWGLEAAEAVAAGGDPACADVLDLLSGLVDKSLVQVVSRAGGRRYRLLETVRGYAARALEESGEAAAIHRTHREVFTDLAAQAVAGLDGPDQPSCLDRLDLEHDNLRAALRRGLATDPEAGARLAGLLWPFWYRRGHYGEARDWLEQAVAVDTSPATRAAVLTGAGTLAFLQCDYPKATTHLQAARDLYRRLGDRQGDAVVVQRLGSVAREQGDYAAARAYHQAARAAFEDLGNEAGVAASLDYLGFVAWLEGDLPGAEGLCRRAVDSFYAGRHPQEYSAALINLGGILVSARRLDEARPVLEEGLTVARRLGYREGIAWGCHQQGVLALVEQRPADAVGLLVESLQIHHALGDRWRVASVLENLAGALAERASDDDALATARRLLALVQRAEAALADGQWREAVDVDEAVALAVAAASTPSTGSVAATTPATPAVFPRIPLTTREVEVLRLLSEGLTNRQIAEALFISSSTAGVHVSNILRKLEATSRAQAVAVGHRLGLLRPV